MSDTINIDVLDASPIRAVQAKAVSRALRLYAKTGLKPNRAYTPSAMLATARALTGLDIKRGQYERAAQALDCYAENTMRIVAIVRANPGIDAQGIQNALAAEDRAAEDAAQEKCS